MGLFMHAPPHVGSSLFSQVASDRMRGNGLELCQWRFRLDVGNFFLLKELQSIGTAVQELPSLEILKECVDLALEGMV